MLVPKMMRFRDWMSYRGAHKYTFESGVTMLLGKDLTINPPGSNGVGKSSILYAVYWVLRGTIPIKGGLADDVINWGSDSTEVSLLLEDDETRLEVTRTKFVGRGQDLVFRINGGTPQSGDASATQKALDQFLGLNQKLFDTSVFLNPSSKSPSFWNASSTARMDILSHLFDGEIYQQLTKIVGVEIGTLEKDKLVLSSQLPMHQASLERTREEVRNIRVSLTAEQQAMDQVSTAAAQDKEQIEFKVLELQDRIRQGPGEGDLVALQQRVAEISAYLKHLSEEMGFCRAHIARSEGLETGECPTCHQAITSAHITNLQAEAAQARVRFEELRKEEVIWTHEQAQARNNLLNVQQWPAHKRSLENEIENLRLRAYAIREKIDNNMIADYTNRLAIAEHRESSTYAEMLKCTAAIHDLELRLSQLQVLHNGYKTEIKHMLVDDIRTLMDYYSNRDLKLLGRHEQSLQFDAKKKSGEDSFIITPLLNGERHTLPSNGQDTRIDLAITFGLIKTLIHHRPHKVGILMLDDLAGKLDDNGLRDLGILLTDLLNHVPVILIASPNESDFGDFSKQWIHHTSKGSTIV